MTATDAQIRFITKLQAEWADAPAADRAEWESWDITQQLADQAAARAMSDAPVIDSPNADPSVNAAMGIVETPVVDAARRFIAAAQVAHEECTDEARAARAAAKAELHDAALEEMWARVEERETARTIDPATLTKAQASRVMDLLK